MILKHSHPFLAFTPYHPLNSTKSEVSLSKNCSDYSQSVPRVTLNYRIDQLNEPHSNNRAYYVTTTQYIFNMQPSISPSNIYIASPCGL